MRIETFLAITVSLVDECRRLIGPQPWPPAFDWLLYWTGLPDAAGVMHVCDGDGASCGAPVCIDIIGEAYRPRGQDYPLYWHATCVTCAHITIAHHVRSCLFGRKT